MEKTRPLKLLVVLVLLSSVLASCPRNCSNHGTCNQSICVCNAGWAGTDCSIPDDSITSGVATTGSLNSFSWHYYNIQLSSSATQLVIYVNQTTRYGDVDVYVQKNTYPNQNSYFIKDITTSRDIVLQVPGVSAGTWYIGLYGYLRVDYTILVRMDTSCDVNCEHGTCKGTTCTCSNGWAGDACEVEAPFLTSGQVVSGELRDLESKYYQVIVPANQRLIATLSSTEDADLFFGNGYLPDYFEFLVANFSTTSPTVLRYQPTEQTTITIGVTSFEDTDFQLEVQIVEGTCIANCSGHGTCQGIVCHCNSGYNGTYCQMKISPIHLNDVNTGIVDIETWNYYNFHIVTQNNLIVALTARDDSMYCSLYVQSDRLPTMVDYTFVNNSVITSSVTLVIEDPSVTTWFVGVMGFSYCEYTLTIKEDSCSCEPDQSGKTHGTCYSGSNVCVCDQGYGGEACTIRAVGINSGEIIPSVQIVKQQWIYFYLTINTPAIIVSAKETTTVGFIWLFASVSGFPDLDSSTVMDKETNTPLHEVHMIFESKKTREVYIGVYGDPFDAAPGPIGFDLTAYAIPF